MARGRGRGAKDPGCGVTTGDRPGESAPAEKTPAPFGLQLAWWLWVGSTGVATLRTIIQLTDRGLLIGETHRRFPQLSQEQLDAAANSAILLTLLMAVAIFGLYLLLANRMVQGRQWARILMTLLGGLSVAGTSFTLIGLVTMGRVVVEQASSVRVSGLDIAFSVVVMALDAAVLVLLFMPGSNRFFRQMASDRRRGVGPPISGEQAH